MTTKPEDKSRILSRREALTILGGTGISAAAAILLGGPVSEILAPALGVEEKDHLDQPYHWGMVIDLGKCVGCQYCVWACQAVNDVPDDMRWNVYVQDETPTGETFHMTRPCLHCQNAPCADVCPVSATYVRDDGIVIMDYSICIGCRYCQVACPYDARRFNWEPRTEASGYQPDWGVAEVEWRPRGVVEKCTFCIHRLDAGLEAGLTPGEDSEATPACVNICPVGARTFGNLHDPESKIAQLVAKTPTFRLREDLGTNPSVYYVPPEGFTI